jgi:gentisate 1,2-dioxygenase
MEAVQKTPEREAFYKKIDGENLAAVAGARGVGVDRGGV